MQLNRGFQIILLEVFSLNIVFSKRKTFVLYNGKKHLMWIVFVRLTDNYENAPLLSYVFRFAISGL